MSNSTPAGVLFLCEFTICSIVFQLQFKFVCDNGSDNPRKGVFSYEQRSTMG